MQDEKDISYTKAVEMGFGHDEECQRIGCDILDAAENTDIETALRNFTESDAFAEAPKKFLAWLFDFVKNFFDGDTPVSVEEVLAKATERTAAILAADSPFDFGPSL